VDVKLKEMLTPNAQLCPRYLMAEQHVTKRLHHGDGDVPQLCDDEAVHFVLHKSDYLTEMERKGLPLERRVDLANDVHVECPRLPHIPARTTM
jgi:hypothetical protein